MNIAGLLFAFLAQTAPVPQLVVEAKARPLAIREAISDALIRSVRSPAESDEALREARQLADAYAAGWDDAFLVRQVEKFTRAAPAWRAAKVRADSLRRAGVGAYSREGPARAITTWKRALSSYQSLGDSAGQGGTLDNIGAALLALGKLDSAEMWIRSARQMAVAVGDIRLEANTIGRSADVQAKRGNLTAALDLYARASRLREKVGDTRGIASDHNNQGLVARDLGNNEEARRHFEAALAMNRAEDRPEVAATNLVNLAALASLDGDLARAQVYYEDALATWRSREEWAEAASALAGLGRLELRRGDYPAAQAALGEALRIYERTGPVAELLDTRSTLADALAASGNLQGAIRELEWSDSVAVAAGADASTRGEIALGRGDLALRLNSLPDAERRYRESARWFVQAGRSDREAEARQGLAIIALARDDSTQAEALLAVTLRLQQAAGDVRSAAVTRLTLAEIRWRHGEIAQARRQLTQSVAELTRSGDAVAAAEALGKRGMLETEAGFARTGENYFRDGLRRIEGRTAPETVWRLHSGLAGAIAAQGATDVAVRELRIAIDALEIASRSLILPERRAAFLSDKRESYARLALLERKRGLPGAAFQASERLRAREMAELLALGRIKPQSGGAGDLVVKEQDLRRRMAELSVSLDPSLERNEALRGPAVARLEQAKREKLIQAQNEYADVLLQLRERDPRYAAFVAPRIAEWSEVAKRLGTDQAMVAYLLGDSSSIAFVITRDTLTSVDLGISRRELAHLVDFARGVIDRATRDSLWQGPYRRLFSYLIAPVEETGLLAGKSRLVVVPHAELHYLPFATLLGPEGQTLVDRYDLEQTPSASVWLALGERPRAKGDWNALALAPRPDALPASKLEVAYASRMPGLKVQSYAGPAATEALFRREASGARILHLATYGVFNKQNPLFSYVELAPGGGQDGHLEVHEVLGLELAADLVILSACQTALGSGALADVPAGDDWVGLTRAFLYAGASQVLATLWQVNDWATAALIDRFYRALAESGDAPRALAEAQRQVREDPRTADPFYWAGFVLVGGAPTR